MSKYLILLTVFFVTSCDKFPSFVRKYYNEQDKLEAEELVNEQDVESMYRAGKANCCSVDHFHNNDVRALNMFCGAALQGHKASMVEVGKMYMNDNNVEGTIIPYDPALAYSYFTIAEQSGSKAATSYRSKLVKELSEEEFARATVLIQNYPTIPCKISR